MYVCNVYMCNVMYNYSKIVSTAFRVSEDAGNVCMYWCPQVTCKSCDLGDSPVESTPISTDIQGTSAYNTHMTFTQTCTLHTCTGTNQVKDSTSATKCETESQCRLQSNTTIPPYTTGNNHYHDYGVLSPLSSQWGPSSVQCTKAP